MATMLLILYGLNVLCAMVQLMPVITVPVSRPSRHLNLSEYNDFAFGVFGICDMTSDWCSRISVGYESINLTRSIETPDQYVGDNLPSPTIHAVSQLLIMHVVAFGTSELSAMSLAALLIMQTYTRWKWRRRSIESNSSNSEALSTESAPPHSGAWKVNSVPYLNLAFAFSLLSFFSTLLAFLADAVLFTPHLGVLIWIQAIPIILFSIIVTLLCFMRRTVLWARKIEKFDLEDDTYGPRRISERNSFFGDSASDDGFYVFANGIDSLELPYRHRDLSTRSGQHSSRNSFYSQSRDSFTDADAYGDEDSYFSIVQYDDDIPLQYLQPPVTEGNHRSR